MKNPEQFEPRKIENEEARKKEEEREEKKERPKKRREREMPWERTEREERERIIEEYEEKGELSDEAREKISEILEKEKDGNLVELAKRYFKNHREELKARGYNVESKDPGYIFRVVNEVGGWEDLKTEDELQIHAEIEDIATCIADLEKDRIPIDSVSLVLNRLEHLKRRREKELKKATERKDEVMVEAKKRELDELFKIRQELTESLASKNLREEAEKKVGPLEGKDDFVDKSLKERMEKIPDLAKELGYTTEWQGLFIKKAVVQDSEGKIVEKFTRQKELDQFLKTKTEEKVKKDLEKEWEGKNLEREKKIRELIEKEIHPYATSIEKAIGGVREAYEGARERLAKEAEMVGKAVREKSKAEQELIDREFGEGEAKDAREFIGFFFAKELRKKDREELRKEAEKVLKEWLGDRLEEFKETLKEEMEEESKKEGEVLEEEKPPEEEEKPPEEERIVEEKIREKGRAEELAERFWDWLADQLFRKRGFDWLVDKLFYVLLEWQFQLIDKVIETGEYRRYVEEERKRKRVEERRKRVERREITKTEAREEELREREEELRRREEERRRREEELRGREEEAAMREEELRGGGK